MWWGPALRNLLKIWRVWVYSICIFKKHSSLSIVQISNRENWWLQSHCLPLPKIILFYLFVRLESVTLLMCLDRANALYKYGWRKISKIFTCNYGAYYADCSTNCLANIYNGVCWFNTIGSICRNFYDSSKLLLMPLLFCNIIITIWSNWWSYCLSIYHCCTIYWAIYYTSI